MPAKSKAQQRLIGAAEHGAQFPMAQKIRQSMTHQQMHDFAVGSEANKPQHVSSGRSLNPTMKAHGQMVKEAHQHLTKAIPGFSQMPFAQRAAATQEHVRQRRKNGHGLY